MIDQRAEYDLAAAAAERLRAEGFGGAEVMVQTGSGIPVPELTERRSLAWTEIEGFPRTTAPGHRGAFHRGRIRGVPAVVVEGRLHCYEGHEAAHVVRPVRTLGLLGVRTAILTCATGGLREDLAAGYVVRVTDHVNTTSADPLRGRHDPRWGELFVVLAGRAHDRALGALADAAAASVGVPLAKGVYGFVLGPSFETAAQARLLRTAGADVCGMSTVPEVIAATQLGMRTLVLALVANPAGRVTEGASAEAEVLDRGRRDGPQVMRVVEEVVARLGAEAGR